MAADEHAGGSETAVEAWRLGRKAYEAGTYGDAVRLLSRAVAADGTQAGARADPGSARWRRGDRDGAIAAWKRATAQDPSRARAWHNLSTALLSAGRWADAADAATHAITVDPRRAKAWNNLAVARERLGDPVGAETALRRAVEVDPRLGVARGNLGTALSRRGAHTEAETSFRRAAEVGHDDPSCRIGLARAIAARGGRDEAEAMLLSAAKAAPASVDLWLGLGDLRRDHGDPAGALDAFEHAGEAATDLPDGVRSDVARRRRLAALDVLHVAVLAGDRSVAAGAIARLRAAGVGEPGVAPGDAAFVPSPKRGIAAADRAHAPAISAAWIDAAIRDALGIPRPVEGPQAGTPPSERA